MTTIILNLVLLSALILVEIYAFVSKVKIRLEESFMNLNVSTIMLNLVLVSALILVEINKILVIRL